MANIFKGATWFCQLSKVTDSITWKVDIIKEDLDIDGILYLNLNCAVLGANAVSGERNIVEAETKDYSEEEKKWTILNLNLDINPMTALDLNFSRQTTFKLISGSGPVNITGQLLIDNSFPEADEEYVPKNKDCSEPAVVEPSEEDSEEGNSNQDEDDEDESSEDEETAKKIVLPKKRKGLVTPQSTKKRKLGKAETGKNDDSLDEDEENFKKITKKTKASKIEVKKAKKKN